MDFGKELNVTKILPNHECMCADIEDNYLFYGCDNSLNVADISTPSNPQIISIFFIRGECRQLKVRKSVVFITAREQGVYIIDVNDPYNPKLICHYDTMELATGICVFNDYMFVAQRQYGVEIVDISCLDRPKHICRIKTSEAQSVDTNGDYLYVGDWGTCELTTINIKDIFNPYIVNKQKLGRIWRWRFYL